MLIDGWAGRRLTQRRGQKDEEEEEEDDMAQLVSDTRFPPAFQEGGCTFVTVSAFIYSLL